VRPLLALLSLAACHRDDLAARLLPLGLDAGLASQFALADSFGSRVIVARSPELTLRVKSSEAADAAAAEKYLAEQRAMLDSLFAPQRPPYPELLTQEAVCPKEFLPTELLRDGTHYTVLWAGERHGFGVCSDDLAKHRAVMVHRYCPASGRVSTLSLFGARDAKPEELVELLASVRCSTR
jgi:hypothetical protein